MRSTIRPLIVVVAVLSALPCTATAEEKLDVTGKWKLRWGTGDKPIEEILDLKQDGTSITGKKWSSETNRLPVEGRIEGNAITLTAPTDRPGTMAVFHGTVDGNSMKGDVEIGPDRLHWEARRG
ncbi:MAG: hypothetical protein U0166_17750 [Acidobacteriota bacterium]